MQSVFVSSVMRDFAEERAAVRDAIESLDLRPLMAELAPASPDASRTALLPLVARADAVVLVLGARYGFIASSGLSPTEEEFNAARAQVKPVLVFVQEGVEREEAQQAFIDRVGGGWEEGAFTGFFSTPQQLALGVVRALRALGEEQQGSDALPAARARAEELAHGPDRGGWMTPGGSSVRVAVVPVGAGVLIDALVLDDPTLGDRAAEVLRRHGLVPQQVGLAAQATSNGLVLSATSQVDYMIPSLTLGADGAVLAELPVRASGSLGGTVISHPRVSSAIAVTLACAHELWGLLPAGHGVRQVAACVGVPEADHHPLSLSGDVSGSMRMPSVPSPLVAPRPALVVRRAEVAGEGTARHLAIAVKQAFADHDAVMA